MTASELLKIIEGVLVIAGIAAIFFAVFKNATVKATIASQKDLIDTLTAQVKELRQLHIENEKAISKLTGQVEVYKELPLTELAHSMQTMAQAQEQILKILKGEKK